MILLFIKILFNRFYRKLRCPVDFVHKVVYLWKQLEWILETLIVWILFSWMAAWIFTLCWKILFVRTVRIVGGIITCIVIGRVVIGCVVIGCVVIGCVVIGCVIRSKIVACKPHICTTVIRHDYWVIANLSKQSWIEPKLYLLARITYLRTRLLLPRICAKILVIKLIFWIFGVSRWQLVSAWLFRLFIH